MDSLTAIVTSEFSAGHETGAHPENQSRLDAIFSHLHERGSLENRTLLQCEPLDPVALEQAHSPAMIELVRGLAGHSGGMIDGDTIVTPGSWDAALGAAGAACTAVDLVCSGKHQRAFAMARPPGHHAERERSMGFCLFNSVALAALHAQRAYGLERVAIIDWDVHHGNGTQDIFYTSPDVLFCSIHQWPLFPGSGLENETGSGAGVGTTLNVPLPAGSGDSEYMNALDEVIGPRVRAFRPSLILVSAGFDAHQDDPLAMMAVSEVGFGEMAERVRSWSEELTEGQLVLVLEGGYNRRALSEGVRSVLEGLDSTGCTERGRE
jgi:acetoin utilization deacetylase AcuC-like enzyme